MRLLVPLPTRSRRREERRETFPVRTIGVMFQMPVESWQVAGYPQGRRVLPGGIQTLAFVYSLLGGDVLGLIILFDVCVGAVEEFLVGVELVFEQGLT